MQDLTNNTNQDNAYKRAVEMKVEILFKDAKEIENWLRAHWSSNDIDSLREMKRRYMALLDEINILLDSIKTTEL